MNELYIYTTPPASAVLLALDSGVLIEGQGPMTANGRPDAHRCQLPPGTPGQGGSLSVQADGYQTFGPHRGLVIPNAAGEAHFQLDDVHLDAETAEPEPAPEPPPMPADPYDIIMAVYHQGNYSLVTKESCGEFTEACCEALYFNHSEMWGHIAKFEGQNQYAGHAVDAVMLLAGEGHGTYDIIFNSMSPDATPAYNLAGPADPNLWRPYDYRGDTRAVKHRGRRR